MKKPASTLKSPAEKCNWTRFGSWTWGSRCSSSWANRNRGSGKPGRDLKTKRAATWFGKWRKWTRSKSKNQSQGNTQAKANPKKKATLKSKPASRAKTKTKTTRVGLVGLGCGCAWSKNGQRLPKKQRKRYQIISKLWSRNYDFGFKVWNNKTKIFFLNTFNMAFLASNKQLHLGKKQMIFVLGYI